MRKSLLMCVALSLAAAPPAATEPKPAGAVLRITEDDREVLLGFEAQRQLAVAPIQARQAAYLRRLAARLGVSAEDLGRRYQIDLEALTVTPVPVAEVSREPDNPE